MVHPWEEIDLETYETHMSSADVFQLQTLNEITGQQLADYCPSAVAHTWRGRWKRYELPNGKEFLRLDFLKGLF